MKRSRTVRDFEAEVVRQMKTHPKTQELRSRRPRIARSLAAVVALYAPGGQWHHFRTLKEQGRTVPVGETVQKARQLASAVGRVGHLLVDEHLAAALMLPEDLDLDLPALLAALRAEAQAVAALESSRLPGRPLDQWRERFCGAVAYVLAEAEEKVTTTREGLFETVLRCCFEAAREEASEDTPDLERLVRRAVGRMRARQGAELAARKE